MRMNFILGSAKSGTTAIDGLLRTGYVTSMPKRKETWYFDSAAEVDPSCHRGLFEGDDGSEARPRVEVSSSYLYSMAAAERIAEMYPEARCVVILRDPIQRAFALPAVRRPFRYRS